jgi:phage I-like protein
VGFFVVHFMTRVKRYCAPNKELLKYEKGGRRVVLISGKELGARINRDTSTVNKWRAALQKRGAQFLKEKNKYVYDEVMAEFMFKIAELLDRNEARDLDEAIQKALDELPIPFEKLPQDTPPLMTVEDFQKANDQMKTYITQLEGEQYETREELNILVFNMENAIAQIDALKSEIEYLSGKQGMTEALVEDIKHDINQINARDRDLLQQIRALQNKQARSRIMTRIKEIFSWAT